MVFFRNLSSIQKLYSFRSLIINYYYDANTNTCTFSILIKHRKKKCHLIKQLYAKTNTKSMHIKSPYFSSPDGLYLLRTFVRGSGTFV